MPLTGLKVCGKIFAFFLSNIDAKTANYPPNFCKIVAQLSAAVKNQPVMCSIRALLYMQCHSNIYRFHVVVTTGLTVTVVAGIDVAFKSLHLCKLGQHLGEGAAALVR